MAEAKRFVPNGFYVTDSGEVAAEGQFHMQSPDQSPRVYTLLLTYSLLNIVLPIKSHSRFRRRRPVQIHQPVRT